MENSQICGYYISHSRISDGLKKKEKGKSENILRQTKMETQHNKIMRWIKAVLRGKFTVINACIWEKRMISNIHSNFIPQGIRKKKNNLSPKLVQDRNNKDRAEISKIQNKETIEKNQWNEKLGFWKDKQYWQS